MRLGGRLQAAIEVLGEIEAGKRPASDVLKEWGSAHRFAGAGDRAVIGNIVYDVLRRKSSIAWRMDADDARALAFGALLVDGGMDIAAIDTVLEDDKFAPETLEQPRRAAWEARDIAQAPAHVQADVPEWCAPSLEELFGSRWVEEGRALAARPPVDLRVNPLKATPAQTLAILEKAGAAPAPLLDQALRIPPIEALGRHPNVQGEQAFLDGWFEVQDLGSQLAALLPVRSRANRCLIIARALVARRWRWQLAWAIAVRFTPMMRSWRACRRCMSACSAQACATRRCMAISMRSTRSPVAWILC